MSAPHGRGWLHYSVGLALNAIAFAGLGPLIAYPIAGFLGWLALLSHVPWQGDFGFLRAFGGLLAIPGMAPFGLIVSYSLGTVPAALTGLMVGLASSWVLDEKRLLVVAAVVGACLAPSTYTDAGFLRDDGGPMSLPLGVVLLFALTGCKTALLITKLTTGLRLRAPTTAIMAGRSQ